MTDHYSYAHNLSSYDKNIQVWVLTHDLCDSSAVLKTPWVRSRSSVFHTQLKSFVYNYDEQWCLHILLRSSNIWSLINSPAFSRYDCEWTKGPFLGSKTVFRSFIGLPRSVVRSKACPLKRSKRKQEVQKENLCVFYFVIIYYLSSFFSKCRLGNDQLGAQINENLQINF